MTGPKDSRETTTVLRMERSYMVVEQGVMWRKKTGCCALAGWAGGAVHAALNFLLLFASRQKVKPYPLSGTEKNKTAIIINKRKED